MPRMRSALGFRRAAVVAAPALSALLIVAGFFLDPAIGESGRDLAAEYATHAGREQLPGFLLIDFYDIAIYGELGGDAWDAVDKRVQDLPGAGIMFATGIFGFLLTLPVALLAAWRARLLPWWPAVVVLAGAIAAQAIPAGFGLLVWAAALLVLAYVLRRFAAEPAATP